MTRSRLAPLILLAALLWGAPTVRAADALRAEVGTPLQKAQTLIQGRKYKDALRQIDAAAAVGGLTPYEQQIVERLRAAAASGAGDTTTAIKAYEAVLRSASLTPGERLQIHDAVARLAYAGRDYVKAAESIRSYRSAGGDDAQTLALLPQALYQSGDLAAAQHELDALIGGLQAAGQKPSETQLQLLAQIGLKRNDAAAYSAALEQLVAYYPKRDYWLNLILRTSAKVGTSGSLALDLYRIRKLSGTLESANDFMEAAQLALQAGFAGEADQYVQLGYRMKVLGVGADAARHQRLKTLTEQRVAEGARTATEAARLAAGAASGEASVKAGLDRVGYGDFAAGIELIQQGIRKGALPRPDEARLHLGYAQLLAGRTGDALATLKTVQGRDGCADLARLYALTVHN